MKPNNLPPTGIQLSMLMGCYPFGGFYPQVREMRFAAYGPVDRRGRYGRALTRVAEVATRGWLTRRTVPKKGNKEVFLYELTPSGREILETALRQEKGFPKDSVIRWRQTGGKTQKVPCKFFSMRKQLMTMALNNVSLVSPFPKLFPGEPFIYADFLEDGNDGPHDSNLADIVRIVFGRKK